RPVSRPHVGGYRRAVSGGYPPVAVPGPSGGWASPTLGAMVLHQFDPTPGESRGAAVAVLWHCARPRQPEDLCRPRVGLGRVTPPRSHPRSPQHLSNDVYGAG